MTLAGWALVELALSNHANIVGTNGLRGPLFLETPVWSDFRADAQLAPGADWAAFFDTLDARGRARIEVACEVPGEPGKPAATLSARFVAKRRASH
jgi:hypothetical protein